MLFLAFHWKYLNLLLYSYFNISVTPIVIFVVANDNYYYYYYYSGLVIDVINIGEV